MKFTYRFSSRLFLWLGLTVTGILIGSGFLISRQLHKFLTDHQRIELFQKARMVRSQIKPFQFSRRFRDDLQALTHQFSEACDCRVTLIAADGVVLGDSDLTEVQLRDVENHRNRPEIKAALNQGEGFSTRHSRTVKKDLMYVAVPFKGEKDGVVGVVRLSYPLTRLFDRVAEVGRIVLFVTLLILPVAWLAALILARSLGQPVAEISRVARKLAGGQFEMRVRDLPSDENGQLGEALNVLAQKVQDTVSALMRETAQFATILENMVEAVVAVDHEGKIIIVNPAMAQIFGLNIKNALHRHFLEELRHHQLVKLLQDVLKGNEAKAEEIQTHEPRERTFQAQAIPLKKEGESVGALLVLHDITTVRRLENMRKEFIANVSHELRTPLAVIKGYAETLRSGAIRDTKNRMEFVRSIEDQSDRMARLVDDILDLSSIESGRRSIRWEPVRIAALIKEILDEQAAALKKMRLTVDVRKSAADLSIPGDRHQLKTALSNLLDNAIKYNKKEGYIRMDISQEGGGVQLRMTNPGSGIPARDLPRIFERFYRVDKARSRSLGGTGLGLAIVKHIIEAHRGHVSVVSELDGETTVTLALPKARSST